MPKPADLSVPGLRRRYVLTAHGHLSSRMCVRLWRGENPQRGGGTRVRYPRWRLLRHLLAASEECATPPITVTGSVGWSMAYPCASRYAAAACRK
jgi:hypothetical protein